MIDTKHLRTLAEAATPGPWMRLFGERTVYDRMEDGCRGIAIVRSDYSPPTQKEAANIDYIAACSPDVVLALLDALERKDAAIKKCYSEVIRGLADVVNVHTPDKLFDLDAIPRDPVMAIVSRIKTSMEAITKEIGA